MVTSIPRKVFIVFGSGADEANVSGTGYFSLNLKEVREVKEGRKKERKEGRREGRKEGRREGRKDGRKVRRNEGRMGRSTEGNKK